MIYANGTTGLIGSTLEGVYNLAVDLLAPKSFSSFAPVKDSTVIHLAGVVGESQVTKNLELAYEINVEGTLEFARFIKQKTTSRFIFVSSSHVYKPSIKKHLEEDELGAVSHYAKFKILTEIQLQKLFFDEPKRLCIARVFSVLDVGMKKGTLGWAIENLNQENPLRNIDDKRDFLSPRYIGQYLTGIAHREFKFPIVNVCSGIGKSIGQACVELRAKLGLGTDPSLLISGNSEVPSIIGDNSRLKCTLSFSPTDTKNDVE